MHFKRRDTSLARFNLHACKAWRINVKLINFVSSRRKFFPTVAFAAFSVRRRSTNVFALTVLRENIITSCQKDMGDLFEPTLETRFAPLSHLPLVLLLVCSRSCRANKWKLKRRGERVPLEAVRRTARRKRGGVIQRTNGEAKGNGNVYKRMSARQCAQKTP